MLPGSIPNAPDNSPIDEEEYFISTHVTDDSTITTWAGPDPDVVQEYYQDFRAKSNIVPYSVESGFDSPLYYIRIAVWNITLDTELESLYNTDEN